MQKRISAREQGQKRVVEHPVELDVAFLRQLLAEKRIFPRPFGVPFLISKKPRRRVFLELCDELRAKTKGLPKDFAFEREEIAWKASKSFK